MEAWIAFYCGGMFGCLLGYIVGASFGKKVGRREGEILALGVLASSNQAVAQANKTVALAVQRLQEQNSREGRWN